MMRLQRACIYALIIYRISVSRSMAGRWLIKIKPIPFAASHWSRFATNAASVGPSRPSLGSSSTSQFRPASNARATASLRCWPPESLAPPSPIQCSNCPGKWRTNASAQAVSSAFHSSVSVTPGLARRRLSATVPAISPGSCNAGANTPRNTEIGS